MSNPVQGKGSDVLDSQEQVRFEMTVFATSRRCLQFGAVAVAWRSRCGRRRARGDAARYRFFPGFHGGDARAWLLQIVRNGCYTWMEKNRRVKDMAEFDEEVHGKESATPEALAIAGDNHERLTRALESLPARVREIIVLRELEGCSYKEIATITSIPDGHGDVHAFARATAVAIGAWRSRTEGGPT